MKITVRRRTWKKNSQKSGKHSGKASRDQTLLQANVTVWEAGQCLSIFRRCVNPYVYAVFLWLPCELISPWQRFQLADKLITSDVTFDTEASKLVSKKWNIEALYRSLIRFAKSTWSKTSEASFAWIPRDCFISGSNVANLCAVSFTL